MFLKSAKYLLVQAVDEHDLGILNSEAETIYNHTKESFSLVVFKINDWNNELSRWKHLRFIKIKHSVVMSKKHYKKSINSS